MHTTPRPPLPSRSALALLVILGVAAVNACTPGAAPLAGYGVDVVIRHEAGVQQLGYLFTGVQPERSETCASLNGATVEVNGTAVEPELTGGWHPALIKLAGSRECDLPFVSVDIPSDADGPALLEIDDGDDHFALGLDDGFRQVDMELTALEPTSAVVAVRAPFAGEVHAWLRDDVELAPTEVDAVLDGDQIRVTLPATRTERTLHVRLDGDVDVARCEGFGACSAIRGAYVAFDLGE